MDKTILKVAPPTLVKMQSLSCRNWRAGPENKHALTIAGENAEVILGCQKDSPLVEHLAIHIKVSNDLTMAAIIWLNHPWHDCAEYSTGLLKEMIHAETGKTVLVIDTSTLGIPPQKLISILIQTIAFCEQ